MSDEKKVLTPEEIAKKYTGFSDTSEMYKICVLMIREYGEQQYHIGKKAGNEMGYEEGYSKGYDERAQEDM